MAHPVLIDTDMGVDDAVAMVLALCAPEIDLVGVTSVGGNVSLDQVTQNIGRLLSGLRLDSWPVLGRGLDQDQPGLQDATHVFGSDGLGDVDLPVPSDFAVESFLDVYEQLIEAHGHALRIVAMGPLTNLAAVMTERPGLLEKVGQIVVMGGAFWCQGNVTPYAEFNFYRDPRAAQTVLTSRLPITVVPLDVTVQVALDESHTAHLSRSGTRGGELLARMIQYPLVHGTDATPGGFLAHDALTVGVLLWPALFLRSKMAIDVVTSGEQAGRCKPKIAKDKSRQLAVVISVNVVDFLENLLEQLCQERFVV